MEFIILLLPLAILLMMAFAIKDIFPRPMEQTHQILWLLVILAFPFLGVCAYYFAKALPFYSLLGSCSPGYARNIPDSKLPHSRYR